MKEFIAKIRQRYNPSSRWTEVDPVLDAGEIGIESDTGFFKFGNGHNKWTELGYAMTHATVEVDETLETRGQAADAKATGDRLEYLESYVYEVKGGLGGTITINQLFTEDEEEIIQPKDKNYTAEIGKEFIKAEIKWTMNEMPKGVCLYLPGSSEAIPLVDEENNPKQNGTYIYEASINGLSRTTWKWKLEMLNSFGKKESKEATLQYYRYLYYGSYNPEEEITSDLIGQKNKEPLSKGTSAEATVRIAAGEQPFIALPESFGTPNVAIIKDGASGSMIPEFVKEIFLPVYNENSAIKYYVWNYSAPPTTGDSWKVSLSKKGG